MEGLGHTDETAGDLPDMRIETIETYPDYARVRQALEGIIGNHAQTSRSLGPSDVEVELMVQAQKLARAFPLHHEVYLAEQEAARRTAAGAELAQAIFSQA